MKINYSFLILHVRACPIIHYSKKQETRKIRITKDKMSFQKSKEHKILRKINFCWSVSLSSALVSLVPYVNTITKEKHLIFPYNSCIRDPFHLCFLYLLLLIVSLVSYCHLSGRSALLRPSGSRIKRDNHTIRFLNKWFFNC